MKIRNLILSLLVSLPMAASAATAISLPVNRQGQTFPAAISLAAPASGSTALSALGARLPEVARFYNKSEAELRSLLLRDHDLLVSKSGLLHYACEGLVANIRLGMPGSARPATRSLPDTFHLHSRPGSARVIYLDFKGHVTLATKWNADYVGNLPLPSGSGTQLAIQTPPYDIDGNPGTFSQQELANIQQIWERVAESYAPFDVDVTTEDPGLEALRKTSDADGRYGVRVCIGGSCWDWLKTKAGGIAFIGSFTWDSDTPCFVFPAQLDHGDPKSVADACAHEVGHTFGLHHDGQSAHGTEPASAYYLGQGGWAPIMGAGYYQAVVQWSKGDYPFANNQEDDTAIISATAPYCQDLVGDDIRHATPLTGTRPAVAGMIEHRGDVDYYRFTTGAGQVWFNVGDDRYGATLRASAALLDGSGSPLQVQRLDSWIGATLPQGTYYVAVSAMGIPSQNVDDYGSLGHYQLSGITFPPAPRITPVISVLGAGSLTIPNGTRLTSAANGTSLAPVAKIGSASRASFTVRNTGSAALTLGGRPTVRITGPGAAQFRVAAQPSGWIRPGGSTSFVLEYAPTAVGSHAAVVEIAHDADASGFYRFTVSGTASLPGIAAISAR